MAESLTISPAGAFEILGRPYRIPEEFSARVAFSYRRLLEPIPDVPGGTTLSESQRLRQRAYFRRRAVACVVPGLQASDLETAGDGTVRTIHRWIRENRPELTGGAG